MHEPDSFLLLPQNGSHEYKLFQEKRPGDITLIKMLTNNNLMPYNAEKIFYMQNCSIFIIMVFSKNIFFLHYF